MSGRPPGPKKLAAIEQMKALVAKGLPDDEIRTALIEAGLTKVQARELLPLKAEDLPKPSPARVLNDEVRNANIEGAVHFLETIAKRLTPNICDRFNELGPLKGDALTWARKLKGVM